MFSLNDIDEIIEKMNEQKSADKVEPKFKVGDWAVSPNGVYWHIYAIRDGRYQVCSDSGEIADWPLDTNIYHKFTIQDAKDGDVLRIKNLTFIFQEITNDNACHKDAVIARCSYEDDDESFGVSGPDCITDLELITPSTKEQRALLFQKMHEAGYEWYADKKDLKKIEQKPAWSEEDERTLDGILGEIEVNKEDAPAYDIVTYDRFLSWLNSLKERIGG